MFRLFGRWNGNLTPLAVLTDGQIHIGETDKLPTARSISGDATLSKAGVLTLIAGVLAATTAGRAKVADGFFDAATALAKFGTKAIPSSRIGMFVSAEQTGTGASLDVAHGLGSVPVSVIVVPTGGHDGAGAAGTQFPNATQGAHDATNVKVTAPTGSKFKVLAFL